MSILRQGLRCLLVAIRRDHDSTSDAPPDRYRVTPRQWADVYPILAGEQRFVDRETDAWIQSDAVVEVRR